MLAERADKSLLASIEERGRFPSGSVRRCTSSLKRGPIERELRRYLKAHPQFGGRLVNAMGMCAEESAARPSKLPWKHSDQNSRAGRSWFDWLPTFGLTDTQVFDVIRDAGQSPHPAYRMGVSRLLSVRVRHHGLARRSVHRRAIAAGHPSPVRPS